MIANDKKSVQWARTRMSNLSEDVKKFSYSLHIGL